MTTAAELRASQSNPRVGEQYDVEDLANKDIVVTSAAYRPSLYPKHSTSGGFDEYLIMNFYLADDKRKRPRWIQTQAVALFSMFPAVSKDKFPTTGTFTVSPTDLGSMYSLV